MASRRWNCAYSSCAATGAARHSGGSSRHAPGLTGGGSEQKTWHRLKRVISVLAHFSAMRTKDAKGFGKKRPNGPRLGAFADEASAAWAGTLMAFEPDHLHAGWRS